MEIDTEIAALNDFCNQLHYSHFVREHDIFNLYDWDITRESTCHGA